ncbi:hypothetical protein F2Q70_00018500 [Brassica cretica]|uniref:Uncharacterized protein n=1 Tax=Brassica cretica TaxID=69181 RepID=A0A8S9I2U3_BRACR|nr:hypothetical protein F2Q70_00018500 [Brassica cretica]
MICVWQSERCICLRRLSFNLVVLSMDLLHVAPDDLDHRCRSNLKIWPAFWGVKFRSPSSLASQDEIGLVLDRLAPCLFSRDWLSYCPSRSLLILPLPDD